ncbi:cytidylate kinase [Neoconidiobolus thromboides FSU 785]|nr:cytidylate kinase [Neoconidiobolus thromboides FSU 785]
MRKRFQLAIDGPAASGKSTTAKLVAKELGFDYLDTGALYRAVTLKAIQNQIFEDEDKMRQNNRIINLLNDLNINMKMQEGMNRIYLNGKEITEEIRDIKVTEKVSQIASISEVRKKLYNYQISRANDENELNGIVMEGRDIGSVVLPNADVKIFLLADVNSRARRRYDELKKNNKLNTTFEAIFKSIEERDHADYTRKLSPLLKARDAISIDTSNLSIREQVDKIVTIVSEKLNK